MLKKDYIDEIINFIKAEKPSKDKLNRFKIRLCSKHKIKEIPTDIEIMLNASESELKILQKYLQTKPTRTISGVSVVAVMSAPYKCPHGDCIMCPSKVSEGVPQSYTGKEPATLRAVRNKFDPYLQVFNRLEQYIVLGHNFDKIELIVMGGTFPSFPSKYKESFVTNLFKAMNDFSSLFFIKGKFDVIKFRKFFELPGDKKSAERQKRIFKKILKIKIKNKKNLEKEQERNEKSNIKCVGLTIETRSDYGKAKQGNELLRYGCTRVELGIQSVYNSVLKFIQRGHTVEDNIDAIKDLRDLGFKLNFHYMPGLVSYAKDLKGLKMLFDSPNYRPDMLKLYPCMVVKDSKLYKLWKKGEFKPITTAKAAKLIMEFKKSVPEYCRIMRVQRDIPTYATEAGVDRTNLRQYIHEMMKREDIKCRCIRCREIGRGKKHGKVKIKWSHYSASLGDEFFISAEDKENLYGFCRLRFPSQFLRKEISKDSALVRELHVYGTAAAVGSKGDVQHMGLGKALLKKAEEIAKTYYKKKMVVISGVGVRGYYRKLRYKKEGYYMVKKL